MLMWLMWHTEQGWLTCVRRGGPTTYLADAIVVHNILCIIYYYWGTQHLAIYLIAIIVQ